METTSTPAKELSSEHKKTSSPLSDTFKAGSVFSLILNEKIHNLHGIYSHDILTIKVDMSGFDICREMNWNQLMLGLLNKSELRDLYTSKEYPTAHNEFAHTSARVCDVYYAVYLKRNNRESPIFLSFPQEPDAGEFLHERHIIKRKNTDEAIKKLLHQILNNEDN